MKLNIQLFAYTKKEWKDLPSKDTPILAADLNNIENQLQTNTNGINTLNTNLNNIENQLQTNTNGINTLNTNLNNIENQLETNTNDINALNTYSTSEQRIGTWIDGKPIYRKVVVYTGAKSNYLIIPHGISNFEEVINITGKMGQRMLHTAYSNNGTLDTNNFFGFIYLVDVTNIEISLSNFFVEQRDPLIFILEYTKTTD